MESHSGFNTLKNALKGGVLNPSARINRPPLEYSDYDSEAYRTLCRELLLPYVKQLKEYIANGYLLMGIISIHNSPSCSISGRRGVYMEELFSIFEKESLPLKYVEIPEVYDENNGNKDLENKILALIRGI